MICFFHSEFIQDVQETLGCQFYLNKKGDIHWLGTNVNLLKDYDWVGSVVDWDLRDYHKDRVYERFIKPVAEYLHKKGYFGIAGMIKCSAWAWSISTLEFERRGTCPTVKVYYQLTLLTSTYTGSNDTVQVSRFLRLIEQYHDNVQRRSNNCHVMSCPGIDIITSSSGDYLVDMNARLTGFTPHALIAPVMARDGLTKSLFKSADNQDCSTSELIKKVNKINEKSHGKIIILYSMDVDEGCIAAIVAFGETVEYVEGLFDCLALEKLVK